MKTHNECILTLDIDWAPDWIIDQVAEMLTRWNVRATWFVTHQSSAIDRLRNSDLFELGLHPNMLKGSTHGKTEEEVLSYVKKLVPDAVSMRTHGLYQSTNFLRKAAAEFGIKFDTSILLPGASNIRPHMLKLCGTSICRIPSFWEDDFEMNEMEPAWNLTHVKYAVPGVKVFDFHPVHIALNTESLLRYERLKQLYPVVTGWSPEFVMPFVNPGQGVRTLFLSLLERLENGGRRISDVERA